MTMIHLDDIRRQFGPQLLFDGLSWMIPREARLGLVGPNGAGKTTLLRILAGQDEPDHGTVRQAGGVQIGYLPQEVEALEGTSVLATVLDGFTALRQVQTRLASVEENLAATNPGDPRTAELTEEYGELRGRYEALGGDRVEPRARAILGGLGIGAERFGEPLASLSGGWRMRVVLARLLLTTPDLLLLDEPTNHLDLEALEWMEGFLAAYPGAFIVVSHDRYFLNRMVRGIVELGGGELTTWTGNYDDYLARKETRDAAREKAAHQQAREIARTERFIERFRYKNTKSRQVQSRVKALQKLDRIDAPSRRRTIHFGFPKAPRSGEVVARLESVTKSYGAVVVYRDLNLVLRRGDRVALVGPNGAGKSTLVKLLAGDLFPDAGEQELGHNVTVTHFSQHHLEALDPTATALEEMERGTDVELRPRLRGILGRFLFSGADADKKVAALSGGEKARLALARMLIRPANLLLLDEPTNHLDLRSREVLEDAMAEYDGTLVLISHDRYFINRVATSIAEVGGGRIVLYPGNYDTFLERRARGEGPEAVARPAGEDPDREARRSARRAAAEERNRRHRERRAMEERMAPVEEQISRLEERLADLIASQADPQVYASPDRARSVAAEKTEVEARLKSLYERWEALATEADP